MGLFSVSLHFRNADENALNAAIKRRGLNRYRVLAPKGGWTTLYEERASQQDDEWIHELTGGLSRDLHVAAFAFMVHDSDIARYWLFDDGRLIDEYNSFPDYFDMDASGEPSGPSGGRPDFLVRYCRAGVREKQLAAILTEDATFAESVIEQLAKALGIDPDRALGDFRDADGGDGPDGFDGFGSDDGSGDNDDDNGDDEHGGRGPNMAVLRQIMAGRIAKMFGLNEQAASANPQAAALVKAAVSDNVDEIARLLSAGAPVDAEAPAPLPAGQPLAGLGQLFPGGVPEVVMTPLMAAVAHKQSRAAAALLASGAEPNRVHPLFGTPIHTATGGGDADLLKLLIDQGGDVNAPNAHGQTALTVLAASRASLEQLAQAQAMMKSMGYKGPGVLDQLSTFEAPTEGWDRCEQVLRAYGAR
jgi:hypothetical protein